MQPLLETLQKAGVEAKAAHLGRETRLLLLPHYGRVLGLYPTDDDRNFLWTHHTLTDAAEARQFFARSSWHNPGGDRTWLAPEREFFIPDVGRALDTYWVPGWLDPGCWQLRDDSPCIAMTYQTDALYLSTGRKLHVQITKRISQAANPLRDTAVSRANIQYAGYTLNTEMAVEPVNDDSVPVEIGLWQIAQFPDQGQMWVSLFSRAQPLVVFGSISDDNLQLTDHHLRWRMDRQIGDAKLSLKAVALTGRAGYRCEHSSGWCDLVIRRFTVNPSGEYVDTPWTDAQDRGYAFQACRASSDDEKFSELEYHAPAVTSIKGCHTSSDESQLWAFRGSVAEIDRIMDELLGVVRGAG